jgi:hypothetical protein
MGVPVTRYFMSVGSALAALLLIASWSFSNSPSSFADRPEIIATAAIRIKSERKWPEKIELDTSQPTIVPPDDVASPLAAQPARPLPEDRPDKPRLEALAQLNPDTRLIATEHRAAQIKRRFARTSRSNRVAKVSAVNRLARSESGEACCRFGWANNWQPNPDAVSRRHAMSSGAKGWLAFSQR